ncbi:hypothetical protein ACFQ0B_62930 [Nonomuraea thailandensis]
MVPPTSESVTAPCPRRVTTRLVRMTRSESGPASVQEGPNSMLARCLTRNSEHSSRSSLVSSGSGCGTSKTTLRTCSDPVRRWATTVAGCTWGRPSGRQLAAPYMMGRSVRSVFLMTASACCGGSVLKDGVTSWTSAK